MQDPDRVRSFGGYNRLVIGSDAFFTARSEQLGALALRHAVPAARTYRLGMLHNQWPQPQFPFL